MVLRLYFRHVLFVVFFKQSPGDPRTSNIRIVSNLSYIYIYKRDNHYDNQNKGRMVKYNSRMALIENISSKYLIIIKSNNVVVSSYIVST